MVVVVVVVEVVVEAVAAAAAVVVVVLAAVYVVVEEEEEGDKMRLLDMTAPWIHNLQDLWLKVESLVDQHSTTSHSVQELMDSYDKVHTAISLLCRW